MLLLMTTLAATVYVLLALGAAYLTHRTPPVPRVPDDDLPQTTIIVPARDEEEALPACLEALARQDFPPGKLEVLVADDYSNDGTADIVRRHMDSDERLRLVDVASHDDSGLRGKARALHAAIGEARGDMLLFTDADCRPPPTWSRMLVAALNDDVRAGVVSGLTVVCHTGWRGAVQRLDWLLLLGTSAGAALAGRPLTAMGNNMGVRREAYEAVGGYPALSFSVTEDYAFFQAVDRDTPFTARLLPDAGLSNVTEPVPTLREAFEQRRRWARGGLRARTWVYGLYAAVFATHLLLVLAVTTAPAAGVLLLGAKVLADATVINTTARRLSAKVPWRHLPVYEGLLFAYVLALPAALAFAPHIRWKERIH